MRHSVLIYRLGSLGDTLLALPALKIIRSKYPTSHIVLLTNVPVDTKAPFPAEILRGTGLVDEYLSYPIGLRNPLTFAKLIFRIQKYKFSSVINLQSARSLGKNLRDYMFLRLLTLGKIVGTPTSHRDIYCTKVNEKEYEWEALRLLRRVNTLGSIDVDSASTWDLNLTEHEKGSAYLLCKAHNIRKNYIVICIGTKAASKNWGEKNWCELIKEISRLSVGFDLVALGAQEEFDATANVLKNWNGNSANLCGQTSSRVSSAILSMAVLYVGLDSGAMHLAAGAGTSCVIIFSSQGKFGKWLPVGGCNKHTIFYSDVKCAGCELEICATLDNACLEKIRPTQVADSIYKKLASQKFPK